MTSCIIRAANTPGTGKALATPCIEAPRVHLSNLKDHGEQVLKKMHFSSQALLLAPRTLQKKHQILPVHPVDRLLSVIFHPHELVVRYETLLEQLT